MVAISKNSHNTKTYVFIQLKRCVLILVVFNSLGEHYINIMFGQFGIKSQKAVKVSRIVRYFGKNALFLKLCIFQTK